MDTKLRNISRSIPVRVILNVLLIVSIFMGSCSVINIMELGKKMNNYSEQVYEDKDRLYGNTEFQDEISSNLQEVMEYIVQTNCLKKNKTNEEYLKKRKKEIDEICKNFHYRITIKDSEGKETVISNGKESDEQIKNDPLYISYQGIRGNDGYITDWENSYRKDKVDFEWMSIRGIMREICYDNSEYLSYIINQVVEQLPIYKDDIHEMLDGFVNDRIHKKLYGTDCAEYEGYDEDFEEEDTDTIAEEESNDVSETKKNSQKYPFELTESEVNELKEGIKNCWDYEDFEDSIPVEIVLGTPEKYTITFGVKSDYFEKQQEKYESKIAEKKALQKKNKQTVKSLEKEQMWEMSNLIKAGAVCFVVLMLLCCVCGRRKDTEEVQKLMLDNIGGELIFVAEAILCILVVLWCDGMRDFIWDNGTSKMIGKEWVAILPTIGIWMMVQFFFVLVRQMKRKELFTTTYTYRIVKKLGDFVAGVSSFGKMASASMICMIVIPILIVIVLFFSVLWDVDIEVLVIVFGMLFILWLICVGVAYHVYYFGKRFEQIYNGVEKIKSGELSYEIPLEKRDTQLNHLAENINSISGGLGDAVNERMKSERLKTELISNVSHDIKTPLTSIITYVDLMKKEDIQPECAKEYVAILDQKAQRLKTLTDDLFEAAKATSGAMSMNPERLDLGALVSQGIGEFTEKLEKSELEVKNSLDEEMYFVKADGRLLWRIFENILSNVCKYAMVGSRVYMDAVEEQQTITFTVKNISGVELNISAEELMERFTRGDRSRNTEGSGLGLNIAKSLAELQGGSFYVEIDGDLFKTVLTLPRVE